MNNIASTDTPSSPSRLFVLRPVATSLLMVALLLAGLIAYRVLPISALPEVDYPTIQVTTQYPGASPDVVGATITAPLERQLGEMGGLVRMSSMSSAGASAITLQFGLDIQLDVAEQEVQAALNAANLLLPDDLPAPPLYAKINPADAPVLSLAITSRTRRLSDVQDLVDRRIANRIAQISGVGQVSLSAGQRPAIRIQADMAALAARGLSLEQLRNTVVAANVNGAKGSIDGAERSWQVEANDQLADAAAYRGLIIAYRNGAPVRLSDVARVIDGSENRRIAAWVDRTPAIVLDVQRQPGANVIATVDRIKQALPALTAALPRDVHVRLLADRTQGIRASVHDVQIELLFSVVLVTLVIFLFLGSWRATLVAGASVPLSLVGSLAGMYLFGFSLNNLTLMALTIASGFVVDDAIVVIENVARHLERERNPLKATLRASAEIGFTIVSLTVSLVAVLIPLLFMGDVVGRLFREFAVTLAIAIILSAIIALTLVPMLSARWLRPHGGERPSRIAAFTLRWFDALSARYGAGLAWILARQRATLAVFAGTLLLTVLLAFAIPKGLFPEQDTGQLQATVAAPQGTSFERMAAIQAAVAQAILADPDVLSLSSNIGVDGINASIDQGRMRINLKPKGEQRTSQAELMARLRDRVSGMAGVRLYVRPVQDLTIDTDNGPTSYRFSLQGSDQREIDLWAGKLVARLRHSPKLASVVSDVRAQGAAAIVRLDRDAAARLGISAAAVDAALYNAFGQRIISTVFTQSSQYRVILESRPDAIRSPDGLANVYLSSSDGQAVPLSAVARIETGPAALQIARVAQFPSATIGFDLAPNISLGAAVAEINAAGRAIGVPGSIRTEYLGAADAFRAALGNELFLVLAALAAVYIVLGVLYESFIHPLTILSTLPSAGIGALLMLMLTGEDLGVIGIIGIVLLIGIVKKNAIMMIDFALTAMREAGKDARAAIVEAARLRFRPIMMTSFAALFGALPLILGGGMGAELRRPLGLAIAGGLVLSQAITLFTTPVIFLAFERLSARFPRLRRNAAGPVRS